jgi:hypothetical protein
VPSRCRTLYMAVLLAAHASTAIAASPQVEASQQAAGSPQLAGEPTLAQMRAAVDELRRDPNLGADKTLRSLRWVDKKNPPPTDAPAWILGLFQFLSQAAGFLLWVAGGIGLAFAAVWIYRVIKARRPAISAVTPRALSQFQDLDIRPDSLPVDVGGAALALLTAGRTREALSLLYRGALSRAVHTFSVPIDASYTEGEALRAVRRSLDAVRAQYFSSLVGLWQRAVYAADVPPAESIAALCRDFSPVLGASAI